MHEYKDICTVFFPLLHPSFSPVAAIFTGLQMIDGSLGWLQKVMGGFVAWEALLFALQDLNLRWKQKGEIAHFWDDQVA